MPNFLYLKVLAEQLVRRCDPAILEQSLRQLIERKQEHDFPWYPAVWCHDILGKQHWSILPVCVMRLLIRADPSKVNPVVPPS